MNSFYFFSGASRYAIKALIIIVALFLLAANCFSFAADGVHINKRPHPQRVQKTAPKTVKQQIRKKHKPQGLKTSSKKVTHNAKIVFSKKIKTSNGVYFLDDMESGINGWTVDTHADTLWHQDTASYVSPTHSWWCGIDSTGTYNTGSQVDQSLISPLIDLTGAMLPIHLLFNENINTEWRKDLCMVGVSTDGGSTWTELRTDTNSMSGSTGGWIITNFDLSSYADQTINIRFHFNTGDGLNNSFPGWFIDNVIVFTGGTISGVAYFDINQNGVRDLNEPPLNDGDWMITATGNLFSETAWADGNGAYSFYLPAGTYTVSDQGDSGWIPISPPSGSRQITLATPESTITANFGNWHPNAIISGYVFSDANDNGIRDSSETLVPNQEVEIVGPDYFDLFTDSTGYFLATVVDTGEYYIYDDADYQTFPLNGSAYDIFVHDLVTNFTNLNFGNYYPPPWGQTCAIGGFLFNDLNKNGVRDSGEAGIAGIEVDLSGDANRTVFSDSTGHFLFDSLYPGYYVVALTSYYWYFSSPPLQYYEFDNLLGGITIDTANFGGYLSSRSSSISGWLFYDKNKNGVKDSGETGIAGIEVDLYGDYDRTTYSDSTGHYMFDSLYSGHYEIDAGRPSGWIMISPVDGYYDFDLSESANVDTANFGELPLNGASISGHCYNNANGHGIGGFTITINGNDYECNPFQRQVTTDSSGYYVIDSLFRGTYFLKESLQSRWVQTVPPNFQPIVVKLSTGEYYTHADFYNTFDSTFNVGYRTFTSDSIALAKGTNGKFGLPIKKLLVSDAYFTAGLLNLVSAHYTMAVTGLKITFKDAIVDSLAVQPAAMQTYDNTRTSVVLSFSDGLSYGDTVQIQGACMNSKPGTSLKQGFKSAYWTYLGGSRKASIAYLLSTTYRFVEPNAVDMLMVAMAGHTIQVGLTLDRYASHTVLMKRYTDIVKSLVDSRGTMHTGTPTCLGTYTGGASIKKQANGLPPSKQNNMLFAEATALKVNLLASLYSVTPFGFGDLIFDEGGENPLNGKSIYSIADVLDQYMSSYRDVTGQNHCQMPTGYESLDPVSFYQTIRKIDSAFCGPINCLYWTPGTPRLALTAVRPVTDISYLHIDSSSSAGHKTPMAATTIPKPERFNLWQNFPNPFNPTTIIRYDLPEDSYVRMTVYDVLGREIVKLVDRLETAGSKTIQFNGNSLPSGLYFIRLNAGTFSDVKKMMLVK